MNRLAALAPLLLLAGCSISTALDVDAGQDAASQADGSAGDASPGDAATGMDTGASCGSPGAPTLVTPVADPSEPTTFNVPLEACTRTATELACDVGAAHAFTMTIDGAYRRFTANGIPDHDVGAFPNPGNPNTISAQSYAYSVPLVPSGTGASITNVFGITVSGVVFDPGTAETWNDDPTWRYEALRYATGPSYFSGAGASDATFHPTGLGLDCNFAHVQPNGAYHYHGVPTGLVSDTPRLSFVGWAADGYPIYGRWDHQDPNDATSALVEMRGSYQLRAGARPSGAPPGDYDGTFGQDWEYVAGSGDLDACNGRTGVVLYEGSEVTTYHYVITNTFPYVPRCFHAAPDASFTAMRPMGDAGMPAGDAGTLTSCTSAADCVGHCPMGGTGCTCGTTPMGMACIPTCTTSTDCPPGPGGMTLTCRSGTCQP
jgi:hypothetical protein